jgi:hypothetical protein
MMLMKRIPESAWVSEVGTARIISTAMAEPVEKWRAQFHECQWNIL